MVDEAHVLELLPAYSLGALDTDEAARVSEHLVNCSECQAELLVLETIVGELSLAVPDIEPPASLRQRIVDYAQTETVTGSESNGLWQQLGKALRTRVRAVPLAVALFLLILILAASNLLLWQQVSQPEVIAKPGEMVSLPLSSTGIIPDAAGFIIISADRLSGGIVVDRLPPLPPEQQYQLWLIRDGQKTSGAVFSVDENGYGWRRVRAPKPLTEYTRAIVTLEPAEGSPSPTGEILLQGPLFPH